MAAEANSQPPAPPSAAASGDDTRLRTALLIAAGLYVVGTGVAVALAGKVLLSRDVVFVWLMGGLLILSLNNPGRWVRGMIVDWLPFILFLFAYDYARSIADTTGFAPHLTPQLRVETGLFGTPIPTVWLQHHLYHPPGAAWYDYGVWIVYMTHFFGTLTLAAILWRFAYPLFKRWRTLVIGLSTVGFLTYVFYPAVPPWLASDTGKISHVEKIKDEMFVHTGTRAIASAVEKNWVDKVAAMPSLHSAFPLMMALLFWHKGWRWRIPFLLYAAAMAFTLVYTAEHFVVDILAGWAYALIVYFAATRWWRWRERRAADRTAAEGERAGPLPRPADEPEPAAAAVSYSGGPASGPGSG
jgi:membrane-associated phospholipid phosphatase